MVSANQPLVKCFLINGGVNEGNSSGKDTEISHRFISSNYTVLSVSLVLSPARREGGELRTSGEEMKR